MPTSLALCHHVHVTGHRCGSPSLRGEQFCYHHHPTRPPARRVRSAAQTTPFDLRPITDRATLQMTVSEIIMRLADNSLDTKRAGQLILCLQMAAGNLESGLGSGLEPGLGLDLSDLL